MGYKYYFSKTGKIADDDLKMWSELLLLLPTNISKEFNSDIPSVKLLAKYLIIKQMFSSGNMDILTPTYVSKNYDLFLECAFLEPILVGRRIKMSGIINREEALVFFSALDQISQAVNENFPNTSH